MLLLPIKVVLVVHDLLKRQFVTLQYELLVKYEEHVLVQVRVLQKRNMILHHLPFMFSSFFFVPVCLQLAALQSFARNSQETSFWIQHHNVPRQEIEERFASLLPHVNDKRYYDVFVSYR